MKTTVSVLAAVLFCCGAVRAAEMENPYAKASVGDWAQYKMTMNMGGMAMEMENKQTIVKKTAEEITVEIAAKAQGMEMPKQTKTFKINEKFNPFDQQIPGGKVKQTATGEETLTVGGKEYKTTWTEVEITSQMGDHPVTIKAKVWSSGDVPVGGIVKMTSDMPGQGSMEMELIGSGKGQ
jgi:hypothetical protein